MDVENCLVIPLNIEKDVALARDEAKAVAAAMGFDKLAQSEVALGVSEICQNALRHAGSGMATISTHNGDKILQIMVEDNGIGIPNISAAMQEGFSTIPTSLGIGLDVAKRTMDKFHIASKTNEGTTIILEKHLPLREGFLEFGSVSVPEEGNEYNGDEILIRAFDGDKVLLSVIDGLGQGYEAHKMALGVKEILNNNFDLPLIDLIKRCDQYIKTVSPEGGIAMSLALMEQNKLSYLGIDDTHAYLQNGILNLLPNFEGRVGGRQMRSLKVREYPLAANDIFILCTDGIKTQVNLEEIDKNYSAQNIATTIFNQYHRVYGDASVLVVKYQPTYG